MGENAFAEGSDTTASGKDSHAEGYNTTAHGEYAHAEGWETIARGAASHTEGKYTIASGKDSHAEGRSTTAQGDYSHAEGRSTIAEGNDSHSEGSSTTASIDYAHAEGRRTTASGIASHAEGHSTTASGRYGHAEGDSTDSSGYASHAEGYGTIASYFSSHAEGWATISSGDSSHSEGEFTTASGDFSHAEGNDTIASGDYTHAEGHSTSTNLQHGAHIMGQYGEADMPYSWFLANGTDDDNLGLAAKILQSGNAYIDVAWNTGGADYAELFETTDGKTIEPGYFVTFHGKSPKITTLENENDYVLGVTSATAGVIGDAGELRWKSKYLEDEWGRILYHNVQVSKTNNKNGETIISERIETQPILNPQWDSSRAYIPRQKRPEWVTVGLLGKIRVRDDGTCIPGGYCRPIAGGIASTSQTGYRVLERLGDNRILILFR